ncbi:MAG TPA: hypothetical protein VLM37_02230 [Fibrobacteraceae bacterium]|nr:hypothetical protein [Fibrobacteraceae bacterium]
MRRVFAFAFFSLLVSCTHHPQNEIENQCASLKGFWMPAMMGQLNYCQSKHLAFAFASLPAQAIPPKMSLDARETALQDFIDDYLLERSGFSMVSIPSPCSADAHTACLRALVRDSAQGDHALIALLNGDCVAFAWGTTAQPQVPVEQAQSLLQQCLEVHP